VIRVARGQNQVPVEKRNGPKPQAIGKTHGIDRSLTRDIGEARVVVAIDEGDCIRREKRPHESGFFLPYLDGDESIPFAPFSRASVAKIAEKSALDFQDVGDRTRGDARAESRYRWLNQWDGIRIGRRQEPPAWREKIGDAEELSLKHFVQHVHAESSPSVEEIRYVRDGTVDLVCQQGCVKASVFYAAEHLDPKLFMKFRKIHWARD
jgi:hypothetical protein